MFEIVDSSKYHIWTRVRCPVNPGPGAFGIIFLDDVQAKVAQHSARVDYGTNNTLEYYALIRAFELLQEQDRLGVEICCHINSQLVVKQMNGIYRARGEEISGLLVHLKGLGLEFGDVAYEKASKDNTWSILAKNLATVACE
jgi:ribonuclease HI